MAASETCLTVIEFTLPVVRSVEEAHKRQRKPARGTVLRSLSREAFDTRPRARLTPAVRPIGGCGAIALQGLQHSQLGQYA